LEIGTQVKHILLTIVMALSTAAALVQETNLPVAYTALGDAGRQLAEHLRAFDSASNYTSLAAAMKSLDKVTTTNREAAYSALSAALEILNRSQLAMDPAFDPEKGKRPKTRVAPPPGPGRVAGMDPM
jgi:hypothetical protein